jgi:hypothetical protein
MDNVRSHSLPIKTLSQLKDEAETICGKPKGLYSLIKLWQL